MDRMKYQSEIKRLEQSIKDARLQMEKTREEFLRENAEFGPGDKVVVISDPFKSPFTDKMIPGKRVEAYIKNVHDEYFSGNVFYDFAAVKKDGTASKSSAGIYGGYSRLELLEKAK